MMLMMVDRDDNASHLNITSAVLLPGAFLIISSILWWWSIWGQGRQSVHARESVIVIVPLRVRALLLAVVGVVIVIIDHPATDACAA